MINTQHKYGYGYKPKYKTRIEKLDHQLNGITRAQKDTIKLIEHVTEYRFSEYPQDKRGANQFIEEHIEDVKKIHKESYEGMTPEDKKLFSRGVAKEDIKLIRQIEEKTGLDFSQYRQIRMEAYRFIEEHRSCLV